jgi:hypothetical protein
MLLRRRFFILDFRWPICGSATPSNGKRPTPAVFDQSAFGAKRKDNFQKGNIDHRERFNTNQQSAALRQPKEVA